MRFGKGVDICLSEATWSSFTRLQDLDVSLLDLAS